MVRRAALYLLAGLVTVGCSKEQNPSSEPSPPTTATAPAPPDDRPAIVAFGDSLSAGYGVDPGQSYPDILQKQLDQAGFRYRVINAGISGDTTSGGLARIDSIVEMKPAMVILELGGNDGLRGLPIEATRGNVEEMIKALQKAGAKVVLAGMTLPPNYGVDYIGKFEKLYKELAARYDLPLVAFFQGIAGGKGLMQQDGIHPSAEGHRIIAANVFKVIRPLLK